MNAVSVPGLAAYFVKGVLDRGIPMHTGVNAQELIGDGARVVGVRATKDGHDSFVKANRGVVIAVSSYERNHNYNKTLGTAARLWNRWCSPSIDGANFRLAGPVGARIARVPDITSLGFHIPGEEDEERQALVAQRLAGHRPAPYHRRQSQGQALWQRGFLPRDFLRGGYDRRRNARPTRTSPAG